jgi:hypothetical protein
MRCANTLSTSRIWLVTTPSRRTSANQSPSYNKNKKNKEEMHFARRQFEAKPARLQWKSFRGKLRRGKLRGDIWKTIVKRRGDAGRIDEPMTLL